MGGGRMDRPDSIEQIEDMDLRYEVTERAAIMEYDGGLSRAEAEQAALDIFFGSRDREGV